MPSFRSSAPHVREAVKHKRCANDARLRLGGEVPVALGVALLGEGRRDLDVRTPAATVPSTHTARPPRPPRYLSDGRFAKQHGVMLLPSSCRWVARARTISTRRI